MTLTWSGQCLKRAADFSFIGLWALYTQCTFSYRVEWLIQPLRQHFTKTLCVIFSISKAFSSSSIQPLWTENSAVSLREGSRCVFWTCDTATKPLLQVSDYLGSLLPWTYGFIYTWEVVLSAVGSKISSAQLATTKTHSVPLCSFPIGYL